MKKTPLIVIISALIFTAGVSAENPSYIIKKGDTLYAISKKYNIKIESIKSFNELSDSVVLYPGMKIFLPGAYTVKKGDTFYSIARTYGISVDELLDLNGMDSGALLKSGQFLYVPVKDIPEEVIVEATQPVVTQVSAVEDIDTSSITDNTGLWPHYGERTALTGKLKGIQITGTPGDDIVSVNNGTVVWAADYGIFKKLVLVEGRNGLVYGYGGNEFTRVRVGDYVSPGSVIGVLGGNSGKSDAFFFIYKDGKPQDPLKAPRV